MDPSARPITAIDEPGVRAEGQLLYSMRKEVASLLGRQQTNFPGAQPVSFSRKHLDELLAQDYYVCEKSDGIRYLLYSTADEEGNELHYLVDRKNDYWFVHRRNLHFPLKGDDRRFHTRTLADGELVMDDAPDGAKVPRFLVFDCLVLDGKDLMARTLDKRLAYFQEHVMNPYRDLFRRYPEELPYQAFQVAMKDMQLGYGIEKMFREVLPSLKHGNDGLIFTCRNSAYQFGTDPHILKWKPVHENTVDFRLRLAFPTLEPDEADRADGAADPYVDWDALPRAELLVYWGDTAGPGAEPYQPFADLHLAEDEWDALKALGDPLQNRVVECALDEAGRWRLYRFRDDKAEANHISTVRSVMESIRDSVSEQELLDAAPAIKESWKLRQAREVQGQKR